MTCIAPCPLPRLAETKQIMQMNPKPTNVLYFPNSCKFLIQLFLVHKVRTSGLEALQTCLLSSGNHKRECFGAVVVFHTCWHTCEGVEAVAA